MKLINKLRELNKTHKKKSEILERELQYIEEKNILLSFDAAPRRYIGNPTKSGETVQSIGYNARGPIRPLCLASNISSESAWEAYMDLRAYTKQMQLVK